MGIDPESVTIFNSPVLAFSILSRLLAGVVLKVLSFVNKHKLLISAVTITALSAYFVPGPQKPIIDWTEEVILFAAWWILLGVASSIGLGTGLHTFVLYLGPHIAKVTLVAYECNSLPKMLPNKWSYQTFEDCPENPTGVTVWDIVQTVQLESFLWGLGTALGELPPYFIALAARMANTKSEELEEIDHSESGVIQKARVIMEKCLKRYGFITVMLCASIPNPLFDLAGLLCGHFGIPLWKFLGATIIGKAGFKVHIQMLFTIFMCGESHIDHIVEFIEKKFVFLGNSLTNALTKHKKTLHSPKLDSHERTFISIIWELVIIAMISFFIISILNSLVRNEISKDNQKNAEGGRRKRSRRSQNKKTSKKKN